MLDLKIGLGVVAALALVGQSAALAGIIGASKLELDFTKAEVAKRVSWTKSAKLKLGKAGLVYEAAGPEMVDLMVQTTEPYATGLSWRPATNVSLLAHMTPAMTAIKLDNGQTSMPSPGQLFVRYSPDARHWSTWQVLKTEPEPGGYRFSGTVAVARQDYAEYGELLSKYSTLDVPWKSDEEAAVQWIVKAQPDFFAKHQPFIGYVELLYEGELPGGQRIEHLDVEVTYGIGGMAAIPKDPNAQKGRDVPWRYRAP
jgi:hypothetical protein